MRDPKALIQRDPIRSAGELAELQQITNYRRKTIRIRTKRARANRRRRVNRSESAESEDSRQDRQSQSVTWETEQSRPSLLSGELDAIRASDPEFPSRLGPYERFELHSHAIGLMTPSSSAGIRSVTELRDLLATQATLTFPLQRNLDVLERRVIVQDTHLLLNISLAKHRLDDHLEAELRRICRDGAVVHFKGVPFLSFLALEVFRL